MIRIQCAGAVPVEAGLGAGEGAALVVEVGVGHLALAEGHRT